MKKIKILIISILASFAIFTIYLTPTFISHATSEENVFEEKTYSYEDNIGTLQVTLISDTECHVILITGIETTEKTVSYQLKDNMLVLNNGSENELKMVIHEDGKITPYDDNNKSESEDDIDKATLEGIIENLKNELEKYKDLVENDTLKFIINAIISFLTAFGALWLRFRSFDKANLSLNASQKLIEIARSEVENITKDVAELAKSVKNSDNTNKGLTDLFGKSINTLNSAILRLTDRIDALESDIKNKEGK